MFHSGLIDEVSNLLWENNPADENILSILPGLNAIGYREILPLLANKASLEQTLEAVQTNNRHYAKRQLTWFRRYNPLI
jgi:tRNA dimethylallyltransferase